MYFDNYNGLTAEQMDRIDDYESEYGSDSYGFDYPDAANY